ncbi:MAG: ATP-binding protein [Anaerolineales bacterium]
MRLRLILSFTLVLLVSLLTVSAVARQTAASEVRVFMARGGMVGLNTLVENLESYYSTHGTWQGAESLLQNKGMHGNNGKGYMGGSGTANQRLLLCDADWNILLDTADEHPKGVLPPEVRRNTIALVVRSTPVGYLLPQGGAAVAPAEETRLIERLNQATLSAALIAGGLALLLALLLAERLLRPVQSLTRAANALAQGDLSQRVPISGEDELAELGKTFNQMAQNLQNTQELRRALTADIAHELRTPLAVQRAQLEALQDGIYDPTPETIQTLLNQNQLLTRLVDDLRTLALADSGQLTLNRTETDLNALCNRQIEHFRATTAAKNITLTYNAPAQPLQILADSQRIEQILSNILANAVRYTPESGTITLNLRQTATHAEICIHDSGNGIPENALPFIFERFYRADKSRARSEGGTGLGLAIARQLARLHNGNLTAENSTHGGAMFTLTLPLNG